MDKQTLSNYGWIVISVLVLSVLIALATPFGTYVKTGVQNTTYGIFNTEYNAFNTIGVELCKHNSTEIINKSDTYTGDTKCITCKRIIDTGFYFYNNVIPEGGIYYSEVGETTLGDYSTATAVYNEGDHFPTIKNGDVFVYGDYEYRYNMYLGNPFYEFVDINGWSVKVRQKSNTKEKLGQLFTMINGYNITCMRESYLNCSNLIISPTIPKNVTDMYRTFEACWSLISMPNIPNGVEIISRCFSDCKSLINVTDLSKLTKVSNITYLFDCCSALKKSPKLPPNVKNMYGAFHNCISLVNPPQLPETVTNLYATFSGCINLTSAPHIPQSAYSCSKLFANCTSLTGNIYFDRNCSFDEMLQNIDFQKQHITLIDVNDRFYNIDDAGATGINYCDNCNGYCTCGNF